MSEAISYTSKAGEQVTLDKLRVALEIIADDIDVAEVIARQAGDEDTANALNEIFYDVDGLTPAPPGA